MPTLSDDQIINAGMAQTLQAEACRASTMVGWLVMLDPPDYPGKVIARLSTKTVTPYVLVAETVAELHAALPPNPTGVDAMSLPQLEMVLNRDPRAALLVVQHDWR